MEIGIKARKVDMVIKGLVRTTTFECSQAYLEPVKEVLKMMITKEEKWVGNGR
jgi:hypothetical protein